DQEGPIAFHGGTDRYATEGFIFLRDQDCRGVGHLPESISQHFVNAQFGSGSEPVLARAQNPVGQTPVSLILKHGVYHMLTYLGSCQRAFFCNMANEKNRSA